jgi:hypothetical protein
MQLLEKTQVPDILKKRWTCLVLFAESTSGKAELLSIF